MRMPACWLPFLKKALPRDEGGSVLAFAVRRGTCSPPEAGKTGIRGREGACPGSGGRRKEERRQGRHARAGEEI